MVGTSLEEATIVVRMVFDFFKDILLHPIALIGGFSVNLFSIVSMFFLVSCILMIFGSLGAPNVGSVSGFRKNDDNSGHKSLKNKRDGE